MRPRAIRSVPGLSPKASPFERLEQFARMIVRVPKEEADKEAKKLSRKKHVLTGNRQGNNDA
jgi:hypothetical protein